jgi:hypothetical protein
MPKYTIEQGDHLSALAEKFGFRRGQTIWEHPNNAALAKQRTDPHILLPGDEIFIPDKQDKVESRPTTQVHKFQLAGQPLKLKLLIRDINGEPRANEACTLEIDGTVTAETIGGDGMITKVIPRGAKKGTLRLTDLEMPLLIGHLNPIEDESGQIGRLNNLGYQAGDVDQKDAERLRSAIEEFQCDNDLPVTGVCDADTRAALAQVHGS